MRRVLPLLLLLVALAGCGGGGGSRVPAGYESHDLGDGWLLLWKADGSDAELQRNGDEVSAGGIAIRPLGPEPGEAVGGMPQVAAEFTSPRAIENASLFVDGTALETKEGGSTLRQTLYGAPASSLSSGRHVVVAAARAGDSATARAWTFTVR